MDGVKFSVGYNNNKACTKFISFSNFIAVSCVVTTDSAAVEKESIYALFMAPDTFQPTLLFLHLKDLPSQDGIVKTIKSPFSIHDLHHLLQHIAFIASDWANVNSGLKHETAAKFREEEDLSWLSIIWCLSNQVELAINDSLHEHLFLIEHCLGNLFDLYDKSSKKLTASLTF